MEAFIVLIQLSLVVLMIVGLWRVFTKAGQPGWASIIPIYNLYILIKIAGRPGWWLLLMLVPLVNIVIDVIISVDVARGFGKNTAFGVGLFFLPFVFFPILAFSQAKFVSQPQNV